MALAEALKVNRALTTLVLVDNLIGAKVARALADALKVNGALTKLDLGFNLIGDEGGKGTGGGAQGQQHAHHAGSRRQLNR